MRTLGQVIASARQSRRLSQKAVASAIVMPDGNKSMSPAYLNDIEHDRRRPSSPETINAIAQALSLDRDYLLMLSAGQMPPDLQEKAAATDTETYREALDAFRAALARERTQTPE